MVQYELLKAQEEFLNIPHNHNLDVAIYQGGYGSGKTWAGSLLGILLSMKYKGCVGLVGANEYELLKNTTIVDYFNHLDLMGFIPDKHYTYNKTDKKLSFKNGSVIYFKGLEDPEKIKSLNLHWVEVEEASQISHSTFKQLLARLRKAPKEDWKNFQYRLFAHTNPESSKGWIYKHFVETKKDNYRLIIAPTTQNIYLPKHFVDELKSAYDENYYRINVLGEFGDYTSGLVVKNFSHDNIKNLKYNDDLPLHLTCDFNVDPMCWLVAHKDENTVYYIDEIVIENTSTQKAIEEFINRYPKHKSDIIINGDASGDYRNCTSEFTNYKIIENALKKAGYKPIFKLRPFNPPIKTRVAAFNAKVKNANGEINLFISPKCKWLIYNMYNLKFKEGTGIIDVPNYYQIKTQDRELKFLSHPFDAASYLVEYYWAIK